LADDKKYPDKQAVADPAVAAEQVATPTAQEVQTVELVL